MSSSSNIDSIWLSNDHHNLTLQWNKFLKCTARLDWTLQISHSCCTTPNLPPPPSLSLFSLPLSPSRSLNRYANKLGLIVFILLMCHKLLSYPKAQLFGNLTDFIYLIVSEIVMVSIIKMTTLYTIYKESNAVKLFSLSPPPLALWPDVRIK